MGRWDDVGARAEQDTKGLKLKKDARERSRSPVRGKQDVHHSSNDDYKEEKKSKPAEPNFGLSGVLAAETNTTEQGVVLKYQEPPEKGIPAKKWRLYVFKEGKALDEPLKIHNQSSYLFGRDRRVADVGTDHGSCSLQHAVIQYRTTDKGGRVIVRPYLIDLNSTNGTFLNGDRIDPERYYELLPKDVITLGSSTREYVLLAEK
jgi:smad nuclear-interacting protein 1